MPARIVVVHDETDFLDEVATVLRSAGHEVATFTDPIAAWDAVEAGQKTEILVTRVRFPPGMSNGVALARKARSHRPGIKVIFTALPEYAQHTEGLGELLPMPVSAGVVFDTVIRLLKSGEPPN